MENEKPVQPEQPHQRRRDDRIQQRLGKIKAVRPPVRRLERVNERGMAVDADAELFPLLEKNTIRARPVEAIEPIEIATLVGQVVIVGEAERHRNVGGFVTLDAEAGLDDIDRQRRRKRHDEEYGSGFHSGASYRERNGVF
jgi:hypothetical protein